MPRTKINNQELAGGQKARLGIIALESAKELGNKVDCHLKNLFNCPDKTFLVDVSCPRFTTGDAKAIINQSVRGMDLFLLVDVGNYSCTYQMFGNKVPMSPDDHFQDLKRVISAIGGKGERITVIMPMLYGGRQHKRNFRESLDCAVALQELKRMGVSDIITFDAHDPRVQNAVPLMGFDNVMPTYQVLKTLFANVPDLNISRDKFMVVSPDEGAINRNIYYASVLGVDLGMYYKRRDYSKVINGRNLILAHEYLGSSVEGKDVFVHDDVIATGESVLELVYDLRKRGASRIFVSATYALFTEGMEAFDKAYEEGLLSGVLSTNLTYRSDALKQKPWYFEVDVSKYISYIIACINNNLSTQYLLDPLKKINDLLQKRAKQEEFI